MDNIALEGAENINLLEIHTNEIDPSFIGKELSELNITQSFGL